MWYPEQLSVQLDRNLERDTSPINLASAATKTEGAEWLIRMFAYVQRTPSIIVNGFTHAGIPRALDNIYAKILATKLTQVILYSISTFLLQVLFLTQKVICIISTLHVYFFSFSITVVEINNKAFSLLISFNSPVKNSKHEISSPPWGKSVEYFLAPVSWQIMFPSHLKNRKHNREIFWGTWPTTISYLTTATA